MTLTILNLENAQMGDKSEWSVCIDNGRNGIDVIQKHNTKITYYI